EWHHNGFICALHKRSVEWFGWACLKEVRFKSQEIEVSMAPCDRVRRMSQDLGAMGMHFALKDVSPTHENPAVPIVSALIEEALRSRLLRFLAEVSSTER